MIRLIGPERHPADAAESTAKTDESNQPRAPIVPHTVGAARIPAPAIRRMHIPAAVVIRSPAPGIVANPAPAVVIDPNPMPFPIWSPARRDAWGPDAAIARI